MRKIKQIIKALTKPYRSQMKKMYLAPVSNAIRFEMGSNILNNTSSELTLENTKSDKPQLSTPKAWCSDNWTNTDGE